jgi:hypothetical protein
MVIEKHIPLVEDILDEWQSEIGDDYPGYKNHVYRMINFSLAFHNFNDDER